jgi:erythromycin esterase
MVNVGQLVRSAHPADDVVLVGFGGYQGSVIASDHWGGATLSLPLPPAQASSIEAHLHREHDGMNAGLFVFTGEENEWATTFQPHRAVGVVYDPAMELWNYVPTILSSRYDAFLWFDTTSALTPLHGTHPEPTEPETWPTGL